MGALWRGLRGEAAAETVRCEIEPDPALNGKRSAQNRVQRNRGSLSGASWDLSEPYWASLGASCGLLSPLASLLVASWGLLAWYDENYMR